MAENLLINGDRQGGWTQNAINRNNQDPLHWVVQVLPNGATMFWPEKIFGNGQGVMPAIVRVQPEIVHVERADRPNMKGLPPEEWYGTPRALLLDPDHRWTFKEFHSPSCGRHINTATGLTPGRKVRLTCYILPDDNDVPRGPKGVLEDDDCRIKVSLFGATSPSDARMWSEMKTRFEAPIVNGVKNIRPWNKWVLETTVPGNGEVTVEQLVQGNWEDDPSGDNFFFGPCRLEYADAAPAPTPEPGTVTITMGQLNALIGLCDQAKLDADRMEAAALDHKRKTIDAAEAQAQTATANAQSVRVHADNIRQMLEKVRTAGNG